MSSPIGDWINGFRFGGRSAIFPFVALFGAVQNFTESHLSKINRLICGIMFGSSAVLPSLYPAALRLRGLYILDFGIFVGSAILFAVLHRAELALNGKYTLAGFILIGTLVLLSQHISLEDFGPYIPVLVAMSLLVTIYLVPWIRTSFHQNVTTLGDYVRATRDSNSGGSYRAVGDPASVRSIGRFRGNLNRIFGWGPHPLEFQHMNHLDGEYQTTRRPDSTENDSSVDLELGLHQEAESSTASGGTRDPFL